MIRGEFVKMTLNRLLISFETFFFHPGLGSTKFVSFEDRQWHSDCFKCCQCKVSLVGQGFLIDGADILCPDCGAAR